MGKIVLFIIITQLGHTPQPYKEEMPDIDACLAAVQDLLLHPPPAVMRMPEGGSLQASCVLVIEPGDHL